MRTRMGSKRGVVAILVALIVAMPLIPAGAQPCDSSSVAVTPIAYLEIPAVVAADESWRQAYGIRAEGTASALIADVNSILAPTGIRLALADYVIWESQPSERSMSGLLAHLDESIPARGGEFVIGLTSERLSSVDGIAHTGHVHIVARRHPDNPQLDGLVVAHEIGHLLGADHHECDHGYRCVMTPKGFELPARWCDHHVLEMQAGAAAMVRGG